ncbi:MAG: hypoxanthine phosphoribosyltransferase [Candidatus Azotimanducaceae bacterium]|jgi:hypoxanthine phosphoribosyltransferase
MGTDVEQLFSESEIAAAVQSIAAKLNEQCEGEWLAVCVLTGGLFFSADLTRLLSFPVQMESLKVTRYHNTQRGDKLVWHLKPKSDLRNKQVLLIDDIFDEGKTLDALYQYCLEAGAEKVKTAILLDKQHDRKMVDYRPDVIGLNCPDKYVFGYGMDMEGQFRNWPGIYILAESA